MVAMPSASSAGPYTPGDMPMQPSPSTLTVGPVLPSCAVCISSIQIRLRHAGPEGRPSFASAGGAPDGARPCSENLSKVNVGRVNSEPASLTGPSAGGPAPADLTLADSGRMDARQSLHGPKGFSRRYERAAAAPHPARRRPRRRAAAPRAGKRGQGARPARRLPAFSPARGPAARAGARLAVSSGARPHALALRGRDSANRGSARCVGRLAAQRRLPLGMYGARLRARRRALAAAHVGLAVSGSRPPCRDCAYARRRWRLLQRHLAWLRGRADGDGGGAFRGGAQPGADVAPDAASLAAAF